MGRSSVRSLKTARTDPILAGPDRPKTDPKRPKDRGLFSVLFLGENTTIFLHFTKYFGNLRQFLINVNINTIVSKIVNTIVNTIVALKNFFRFFFKI